MQTVFPRHFVPSMILPARQCDTAERIGGRIEWVSPCDHVKLTSAHALRFNRSNVKKTFQLSVRVTKTNSMPVSARGSVSNMIEGLKKAHDELALQIHLVNQEAKSEFTRLGRTALARRQN